MKRSLISLAAMAVAGRVPSENTITLFGVVDAREPEPPAQELKLYPYQEEFVRMLRDEAVMVMSGYRAGKTAALT